MKKSKNVMMHADYAGLMDLTEKEKFNGFLYQSFEDTPEGYLKGRAVVTNIGIFPYFVDGAIENRLRLPEDVMEAESLDSLRMVPLTNNHPPESVTSENIRDYQIGHLGTDIRNDGYCVSADIIITDKETIEMVRDGKVALSCGYFSAVVDDSGDKWGGHYDSRQTGIRYNHVAIVDAGRAGEDARMFVDSEETYFCGLKPVNKTKVDTDKKSQDDIHINKDTKTKENMMKIIVDNKEVEVEDKAANDILAIVSARDAALATNAEVKSQNDTLTAQIVTLTADKDKFEAAADTAKEALKVVEDSKKELEASMDTRIAAEVAERASVQSVIDSLEVKVGAEDSILEMKKKVVISQASDTEATATKMKDASEEYINARFDGIIDSTADAGVNEQDNAKKVLGEDSKAGKKVQPLTADEARKASDAALLNKTNK